MMNAVSEVNWFAVLVASVATFMLGAVWYMGLFKKAYARSLDREGQPEQKPSPLFIVGPFVCGLVVNATDAVLMRALRVSSYEQGLVFGAVVGLGYLVAMTVNIAINPNFPRPFFYAAISGSYFFVGNLVVSLVLVAMA